MFNLDERVVYPGHGVARINRIINKTVANQVMTFYELKLINKDMTILVSTENTNASGIRPLSSHDKVNDVFHLLAQPAKKLPVSSEVTINWKQRDKDYKSKLRTGNLKDISEIYRELKHIERHKELSFCEKQLLQQTELLLAEEIALVKQLGQEKAIEQLRSFFNGLVGRSTTPEKTI